MTDKDITVHVYYGPDYDRPMFNDAGEPFLEYRTGSTTPGLRYGRHDAPADRRPGELIPDGWVLTYLTPGGDVDEWIVGAWDLDGVDDAVAEAKEYLATLVEEDL